MPLYIFHGPDQFSAREELARLAGELDTDGNLANQTLRLDGAKVTPAELRSACQTVSFFAETRLVIVEELLSRMAGRSPGRRRAREQAAEAGSEDPFLTTLIALPSTTTVVLLEETPPPAGALDALRPFASVREFHPLRRDELREWTRRRILGRGGRAGAAAVSRLADLFDGDHLGNLASEIDKLIVYVADRPIEVADVEALVSGAMSYMYWDVTDAVIAGRANRALAVVQRMDERDQPPQVLLFMLARVYRQLMIAQAMLQEGRGPDEVGTYLGIRSRFPLQKLTDQARRYPPARLEQAYRRIFEADVAVKTGVLDADLALEMLIVDLARQAVPPPSRR